MSIGYYLDGEGMKPGSNRAEIFGVRELPREVEKENLIQVQVALSGGSMTWVSVERDKVVLFGGKLGA